MYGQGLWQGTQPAEVTLQGEINIPFSLLALSCASASYWSNPPGSQETRTSIDAVCRGQPLGTESRVGQGKREPAEVGGDAEERDRSLGVGE